MSLATLMIHTCDHYTQDKTKSESGGANFTPALVAEGMPCFADNVPDNAQIIYGKFDAVRSRVFFFDANPNVNVGTSSLKFENKFYDVHSVENESGRNRLWKVLGVRKPTAA